MNARRVRRLPLRHGPVLGTPLNVGLGELPVVVWCDPGASRRLVTSNVTRHFFRRRGDTQPLARIHTAGPQHGGGGVWARLRLRIRRQVSSNCSTAGDCALQSKGLGHAMETGGHKEGIFQGRGHSRAGLRNAAWKCAR